MRKWAFIPFTIFIAFLTGLILLGCEQPTGGSPSSPELSTTNTDSGNGTETDSQTDSTLKLDGDNYSKWIESFLDENGTEGGEQWYKFSSAISKPYIHFEAGTLSEVNIQLYDSTGTEPIGDPIILSPGYNPIELTPNYNYYLKVTPVNGSGSYKIAYNSTGDSPKRAMPENATELTLNTWTDSSIDEGAAFCGEQWFKFTVMSSSYSFIRFDPGYKSLGDALDSVNVELYDSATGGRVSLYNVNNTNLTIGTKATLTRETRSVTPRQLTYNREYYVRVTLVNNGDSGKYRIGHSHLTALPAAMVLPPPNVVTQLSPDVWADGFIEDFLDEQWFKFTATAAPGWSQYIHFKPLDMLRMNVQTYDSTGAAVGTQTLLSEDYFGNKTLFTIRSLTNGNEYYIKVTPNNGITFYDTIGTYQIAFNTSNTPPQQITPPAENVTTLYVGQWESGYISNSEEWFKFTAMTSTYYLHYEPGTLTNMNVLLCDSNDYIVGSASLSSTTLYTSLAVIPGNEYYIRTSNSTTGTYKIALNTSTTPPPTQLPATATALTFDTWANGSISSKGEQWFRFTVTDSTQYLHFRPGTLNNVDVRLYNSYGASMGNQFNLTDSVRNIAKDLSIGEYYIKVTPVGNYSGNYQIAFNAAFAPPGTSTLSTANTWTSGSVPNTDGEQWLRFTATADRQFIHFDPTSNLKDVNVQLYTSSGNTVGATARLYDGTRYIYRGVTNGSTYYIRVTPYTPGNFGSYRIMVSTTFLLPGTNVTELTANAWQYGHTYSSEQWFKFTATANSHYIHFGPMSLTDVNVQLYENTGATTGAQTRLNYGTLYTTRSLTNGREYYIKVTPTNNATGFYMIAFNTSVTPPPEGIPNVTYLTEADTWETGTMLIQNTSNDDIRWFAFIATATTQYLHFEPGTLSSVYVQLYIPEATNYATATGNRINLSGDSRRTSWNNLTVDKVYCIKVMPYTPGDSGEFRITFNATYAPPATALTHDVYTTGSITGSSEQWFKFTAAAATQYIHFEPGTLNDVQVQLYTGSGATVGTTTSLNSSTLFTPRALTNNTTYYMKVTPSTSGATGNYRIAFSSLFVPPGTVITPLTAAAWENSTITAGGDQWFRFTATAAIEFIHFDQGTLDDVYVQVYDNTGATIGEPQTRLNSGNRHIRLSLANNSTYYIRVTPYTNGGSGTYRIMFNTSFILPEFYVVSLVDNSFTTRPFAASDGEQWFSFTATAALQFFHFRPAATGEALNDVYMQVYDNTGAAVGAPAQTRLNASTRYTSRSLTSNSTYYIKVTPYTPGATGTYRILFNKLPVAPDTDINGMVNDLFSDGEIVSGGTGEQWFRFTANAANQYIHILNNNVGRIMIQVYNDSGEFVGNEITFDTSRRYATCTLTSGQIYLIRIRPYNSSDSGIYRIGFNTGTVAPVTLLPFRTMTLGDMAQNGEQWFRFTARAESQYIHFSPHSVPSVYVQVHDSNRNSIDAYGRELNNTNWYYRKDGLTPNTTYYLRVTPVTNNSSGWYEIGFSDSAAGFN